MNPPVIPFGSTYSYGDRGCWGSPLSNPPGLGRKRRKFHRIALEAPPAKDRCYDLKCFTAQRRLCVSQAGTGKWRRVRVLKSPGALLDHHLDSSWLFKVFNSFVRYLDIYPKKLGSFKVCMLSQCDHPKRWWVLDDFARETNAMYGTSRGASEMLLGYSRPRGCPAHQGTSGIATVIHDESSWTSFYSLLI